jgi:hypothetical protein
MQPSGLDVDDSAEHRDGLRVTLNVLLWTVQLLAPSGRAVLRSDAGVFAETAAGSSLSTVISPPSWTFSVWALLYAATFAYVVWQALHWRCELARATGYYAAGAWAFLAAWGWAASTAAVPDRATFQCSILLLLLAALGCTTAALGRAGASQLSAEKRTHFSLLELVCVAAPFSLLAGWLFVAVALNAASAALAAGAGGLAYAGAGGASANAAVAALGLTCVVLSILSDGNPFLSSVWVWALVGISVSNNRPSHRSAAVLAGFFAALTAGAAFACLVFFPAVRNKWCGCGAAPRQEDDQEGKPGSGDAPAAEPLLLARSLSRRYGATAALRDEAFAQQPGSAPSRVKRLRCRETKGRSRSIIGNARGH